MKATKGLAHGVVMSPAEQHSAKNADWKDDSSSSGRGGNEDDKSNGTIKAAGLILATRQRMPARTATALHWA